jgi:hypothetical protein
MGFRPPTLSLARDIMYPNCTDPTTASVADRYDYSHPIGSSLKQHDKEFDAAGFDRPLTDYDRMLLRFGMHILWQI